MRIASGDTAQYIYFVALDATDLITRKTGLSGFTVYRSRLGGAAAAMTTPTINETDVTNMPGVYELLVDEDTTLTGDGPEEMVFHITVANMAPVTRVVELFGGGGGGLTAQQTADAVWNEDATTHQTTGTFGGAIGDPGAVAESLWDAVVADAAGTNVAADIIALKTETALIVADTNELQVDWADAGRLDALLDTAAAGGGATASEIADAVWDEDATAHQTGGTFGAAIGDPLASVESIWDAVVGDATGTNVAADVVAMKAETALIVADTNELQVDWADAGRLDAILDTAAGLSIPTALAIADAVWDEDATGHQTTGTFGGAIGDPGANAENIWDTLVADATGLNIAVDIQNLKAETAVIVADTNELQTDWANDGRLDVILDAASAPTVEQIADAVWDEVQTGHVIAGTFGLYLDSEVSSAGGGDSAAVIADAVWDEVQSGHVTAGSFGEMATELAAVLADTNELQTDWVDAGRLDALLDTAAAGGGATAGEIADAVWDETATDHIASGSIGKQALVGGAILVDTTITGTPTSTTFIIAAGSAIDDFYKDMTILILSGTGTGQARIVSGYTGSSKTILVDEPWITTPGASATVVIMARHNHPLDQVVAGVTADLDANSTQLAAIVADTNELQTDWANAGRLDTILDTAAAAGGASASEVADAVWDEVQSGHVTGGSFGELATEIASILADTNELQTDWVNAGRLDTILDTAAAGSAPSAAAIRTEIDSNSTQLALIVADTNELQTDDIPAAITAAAGPSAATIATAVWGETIEDANDAAALLRALTAVAMGAWVKAGNTVTFRDLANTKDRVAADVTASARTVASISDLT